MRFLVVAVGAIAALACSAVPTAADLEACQSALDQLRSAKGDVVDALKSYADCLGSTDGHDDCSIEFSTLKSDQDDFESAVSGYETDCSD